MNTTIPDLWPAQLEVPHSPSPVAVLRQQAYLLGQKTGNRVVGEIETVSSKPSTAARIGATPPPIPPGERRGRFTHTFWVTAPLLDYREQLLVVKHGFDPFYPAEVGCTLSGVEAGLRSSQKVTSFDEFKEKLRLILGAPEVVNLVSSLSAQSRDEVTESE